MKALLSGTKKRGLRTGFTTGACAAAAARAATRAFYTGDVISEIEITLPNRQQQRFRIERCATDYQRKAICSVVKNAGDDPDCTDKAHITACVTAAVGGVPSDSLIEIVGGKGVARVTKAGLGLPVHSWAINPVPKQNIADMVKEERTKQLQQLEKSTACQESKEIFRQKLQVEISVPQGEEMAKKTINDRLGLIGGISILGTTGIVRPYSTSAFKFSILQAIDIAATEAETDQSGTEAHATLTTLVFTTGGRSEDFAMKILKDLQVSSFIQVGDFIGTAASYTAKKKAVIEKIFVVGMIGKLSKMAQGAMQTHQAGSKVNMQKLSVLAASQGADAQTQEKISKSNTAREVMEIAQATGIDSLPSEICRLVCEKIHAFLQRKKADRPSLKIECIMTNFEGTVIGTSDASRL